MNQAQQKSDFDAACTEDNLKEVSLRSLLELEDYIGILSNPTSVDTSFIEAYKGVIPDSLLEAWLELRQAQIKLGVELEACRPQEYNPCK